MMRRTGTVVDSQRLYDELRAERARAERALDVLAGAELAMADILSGWRYIRTTHGELYGVGWDRADRAVTIALEEVRALLAQERPT